MMLSSCLLRRTASVRSAGGAEGPEAEVRVWGSIWGLPVRRVDSSASWPRGGLSGWASSSSSSCSSSSCSSPSCCPSSSWLWLVGLNSCRARCSRKEPTARGESMGERERGEEEQEGRCRGEVERVSTPPFNIPTEEEEGGQGMWPPRGAGKEKLLPFDLRAREMIWLQLCSDWFRPLWHHSDRCTCRRRPEAGCVCESPAGSDCTGEASPSEATEWVSSERHSDCHRPPAPPWHTHTYTHAHTHRGNLVISFPVYRIRSGRRSLIGCLIRDQFLPLTSTGYVSAALRLRHARGADRFNVLIPTRSAALCICSVQLRQSGTRMSEHDAAIQLNLAASRQEVKRRNNKQHLVTFQNKTLRVDTSTQISKKRQIQALLLILQSGTLPVVVFINTDLWLRSRVIMWLSWELLGLAMPAVYRTAPWQTETATGGYCWTVEQNRIGAVTQRRRIQWKSGITCVWSAWCHLSAWPTVNSLWPALGLRVLQKLLLVQDQLVFLGQLVLQLCYPVIGCFQPLSLQDITVLKSLVVLTHTALQHGCLLETWTHTAQCGEEWVPELNTSQLSVRR